jgi:hypothetical protein
MLEDEYQAGTRISGLASGVLNAIILSKFKMPATIFEGIQYAIGAGIILDQAYTGYDQAFTGTPTDSHLYNDLILYGLSPETARKSELTAAAAAGMGLIKQIGPSLGNWYIGKPLVTANNKGAALQSINELPIELQASVKSFYKRSSNAYKNFSVEKLPNGNYLAQMTKPGNVPGSKAIYYKEIKPDGSSFVSKRTFDPNGNLIHIKEK